MVNVGKYTSPMDPLGIDSIKSEMSFGAFLDEMMFIDPWGKTKRGKFYTWNKPQLCLLEQGQNSESVPFCDNT